jgi:hypothetical protein
MLGLDRTLRELVLAPASTRRLDLWRELGSPAQPSTLFLTIF